MRLRASIGRGVSSDGDDDFAELMLVLQIEQRFSGFSQRESALDNGLELVLVDKREHVAEILRVANLAAQYRGTAQEDIGGVDLELVAGSRSVNHDACAGIDAAHIVGEARARCAVDDDVDAAGHWLDLFAPFGIVEVETRLSTHLDCVLDNLIILSGDV